MSKFLAILNGAADRPDSASLDEQQQAEFMAAWSSWAHAHEDSIVDPGAPLFRKRRISDAGDEAFEDTKVAYAIVEADSHDAAVHIFRNHPHIALLRGNSIEVIECPPVPEA